MLGGKDPVIIFQFSKLANTSFSRLLSDIPLVADIPTLIDQPPIPIYLNSDYTGLFIDQEDKSVDIVTDVETLSDGESPEVSQKGVGSDVTINFIGKKDSVGIMVLSSLIDLCFEKVTSNEYAITYLSGATTIFRARLGGFSFTQNRQNDLLNITITLSMSKKDAKPKSAVPELDYVTGEIPIQG